MFGGSSVDRALAAFDQRQWKRARRLLEEALMDEESALVRYRLGVLYWRGLGGEADKAAAVRNLSRAAESGYPPAQTAYGIALRSGVGIAKDNDAARAQFRAAAGASDGEAMVQLATMSEPEDARRWLTRAAELGYAPAMPFLADLLMRKEPIEALAWLYACVSLSGDHGARERAEALAREMTAREIEAAQKAGRAYAKEIERKARGKA